MKLKLGRRKRMKTYRVGVVGCGGIAQVHGAVLRDLEGVELIACADIRRERAEDFAQKYGGKAYDSMEAMLEAEDLDAVHLCTPTIFTPQWPSWRRAGASMCLRKSPR